MENETTVPIPTMDTLQDWHVGQMSDGFNEVRFVLTSNEEARAWAIWISNQDSAWSGEENQNEPE